MSKNVCYLNCAFYKTTEKYRFEYTYLEIEQKLWRTLKVWMKGKTGNSVQLIRDLLDQLVSKVEITKKYTSNLLAPLSFHNAANSFSSVLPVTSGEWEEISGILGFLTPDDDEDEEEDGINRAQQIYNIGDSSRILPLFEIKVTPAIEDEDEESSSEIMDNADLCKLYSVRIFCYCFMLF